MSTLELNLETFVRGMLLHDIAKPFFLRGEKHSKAGFVLLSAQGYELEGVVALCHYIPEHNLPLYWAYKGKQVSVPALLVLAGAIDQLAASTYSLLDDDLKDVPPSIQSPFSRLPKSHPSLGLLSREGDAGVLSQSIFFKWLKQAFTPTRGWPRVEKDLEENKDKIGRLRADFAHPDLLTEVLLPAMTIFAERTYPAPNDTSLQKHCHLAAALAFIIYQNLQASDDPFLTWMVDDQCRINGQDLSVFIGLSQGNRLPWSPAREKVKDMLQCRLVRVAWEGFRSLFEEAVRLDDLHGIRNLTGKLINSFKLVFAKRLRFTAKDLQEVPLLYEAPFELIYLLPTSGPDLPSIEEVIGVALDTVLEAIFPIMEEDLRPVQERLNLSGQKTELQRQLFGLRPEVRLVNVILKDPHPDDFTAFKVAFGKALLKAFRTLRGPIPPSDKVIVSQPSPVGGPVAELCDVCGANPLYRELSNLFRQEDEAGQFLRKVTHMFRGQPEDLCLLCLATRILSHGALPFLHRDLFQASRFLREEGEKVWVRSEEEVGLELPPAMQRTPFELGEGDYREIGGAFVRRKDGRLQLFPTIDFAADATSNVALLRLEPYDGAIWGEHNFFPAIRSSLVSDVASLRQRLKEARHPLNMRIGPLLGRLGDPDVIQAAGEFVHQAKGQALLEASRRLRPLCPSAPLFQALDALSSLAEPAYQQEVLTSEQAREKIRQDLQPLENLTEARINELLQEFQPEDATRFETYYCNPCIAYLGKKSVYAELTRVKPHLARVMERITAIETFFRKLVELFNNPPAIDGLPIKGIRVLPLEARFPTALLAIPADRLPDALAVLHYGLATELFSSSLYKEPLERRGVNLRLLEDILPRVLYGAVVVFKHRQPLYLVLKASEGLIEQVKAEDTVKRGGLLLGFADMRGILSEQVAPQAMATFAGLFQVLGLVEAADRRSLTTASTLKARSPLWAEAFLRIRGKRKGWAKETIERLQEASFFDPTFFIKTVARR